MTPSFIDDLPKAELHVHLEGTLEPEMLLRLAARNGVEVPWTSVEELQAAYSFTGLEHFLPLLFQGAKVLRRREDFYELTLAYLAQAAAQGVRRAEMFFGAQTFLDAGVPIADQLGGVVSAMVDAQQQWGISPALLLTAQRHRAQAEALELFDLVAPWASDILGFGLGAAERNNPPGKFADYFARCRRHGFRTTIHAGEDGPAEYVREALDLCQPDRIDHGVAAAADAELVARLAGEGMALTMCPLSNRSLQVVPDLSRHPLAELLAAGVRVTVNSDDPPYFGGYVNENLEAVRTHLRLSESQLAELARNSFTASFAPPEQVSRWVESVDRYVAEHAQRP
jgi:adenosine deaminase